MCGPGAVNSMKAPQKGTHSFTIWGNNVMHRGTQMRFVPCYLAWTSGPPRARRFPVDVPFSRVRDVHQGGFSCAAWEMVRLKEISN